MVGGPVAAWPPSALLSLLTPDARAALLSIGRELEFAENSTFIVQGDNRREVFVLLSGFVRITSYSTDGRLNLLAIRGPGDVVGEISALDGEPRSATVITATPVCVRAIDPAAFSAFRKAHADADAAVQAYVLAKLRQATEFRSSLGGASVRQRVAQVLLHLGAGFGNQVDGVTVISFPFSQGTLAAFVGAAEQSVHRELTRLRRDSIVATGYRELKILDEDALTTVATNP